MTSVYHLSMTSARFERITLKAINKWRFINKPFEKQYVTSMRIDVQSYNQGWFKFFQQRIMLYSLSIHFDSFSQSTEPCGAQMQYA